MALHLEEQQLRLQLEDLVDESRGSLQALEQDVLRRVARRRRRRAMATGGRVLAVVAFVLVAATVLGDPSAPDVRTDGAPPARSGPPPLAPADPVGIERIDAYGSPAGTARIVVHFDGPVPTDPPAYVDDIEHPDAPGIVYTAQGPQGMKVCQNTHWFPGDKGSVDVLIPIAWLKPGTRGSDIPLERYDNPAKVPVCGGPDDTWPLDDHLQIAIWGPASDDPADVTATVSPTGTDLTLQIHPPTP